MKEVLCWHPKFNVYVLPQQDLLLISEQDSFCLSQSQFPFFNGIDGIRPLYQIIADTELSSQQALNFIQQSLSLKNDGILIGQHYDSNAGYCNKKSSLNHLVVEEGKSYLLNRTISADTHIPEWLDIFSRLLNSHAHRPLGLILVDDFLDADLDHLPTTARCYIRATADHFWILYLDPIKDSIVTQSDYLQALQKRLLDNKPSYALVKRLFPDDHRCIPFNMSHSLSLHEIEWLAHTASTEFFMDAPRIVLYDRLTHKVEFHPIQLSLDDPAEFARQIHQPIELAPCMTNFNRDGGYRSLPAEVTVNKILPWVSPITGLITHIRPLHAVEDHAIQIFSTAFFKHPPINNGVAGQGLSFVQTCLGKGVTHAQSQASALCEAIERKAALYQGNEPTLRARRSELPQRSYDFFQLAPYSDDQYQQFNDPNHPHSQLRQAALRYEDDEVHWLPTWSLTQQESVYVPLACSFANIPFADQRFGGWHSNGCAAGNCLEEAILQGLLELIERDAVAIWWYNRIPRPEINICHLDTDYCSRIQTTLNKDHDFWVLDLTTDIGVPVMAAIGMHKSNGAISFGFGCHLRPQLAAQRALTELCQLIPIRGQKGADFDFDAIQAESYLFPQNVVAAPGVTEDLPTDLTVAINSIVEQLNQQQLETLVLNYSRASMPMKTAKVFVPGLCHIWPQLGNPRLYQLPVTLGWLNRTKTAAELNPQALYI